LTQVKYYIYTSGIVTFANGTQVTTGGIQGLMTYFTTVYTTTYSTAGYQIAVHPTTGE
jgi:hypothetical protein